MPTLEPQREEKGIAAFCLFVYVAGVFKLLGVCHEVKGLCVLHVCTRLLLLIYNEQKTMLVSGLRHLTKHLPRSFNSTIILCICRYNQWHQYDYDLWIFLLPFMVQSSGCSFITCFIFLICKSVRIEARVLCNWFLRSGKCCNKCRVVRASLSGLDGHGNWRRTFICSEKCLKCHVAGLFWLVGNVCCIKGHLALCLLRH